jgi:hypothetical protein
MIKMDNKEISESIKKKIIDFIIESPLNIQSIPDDIEGELYNKIFEAIEGILINQENTNTCANIYNLIKSSFNKCLNRFANNLSKNLKKKSD